MPSSWPGALDNLPTDAADATTSATTHPGRHNANAEAINAVEAKAPFLIGRELLASAGSTFPDIVIPSGVTRIWGHVFYLATAASIPRLRLGGASIDTGANYAYATGVASSTTLVSVTASSALTLGHALLASGNTLFVEFSIAKPIAGLGARLTWTASGVAAASGTAPVIWQGRGYWHNVADALGRIQLMSVTTLTGTTAVNAGAGSEIVVYGSR